MTLSDLLQRYLPEQSVENSSFILFLAATGTAAFIHTDENRLLSDNLYVLPGYTDVVTFSRQVEKSAPAPDDDGTELSAFTADFHIAHTAETVTVFGIDNLFIAKVGDTAVHKIHLITVYAEKIRMLPSFFTFPRPFTKKFSLKSIYNLQLKC